VKIVNRRLDGALFVATPNMGGPITPEVLVLHYTVSWPAAGVVRTFQDPASKVSAHLVLDLDGSWTQLVPFTRSAWHAGPSAWEGRNGLNSWSIGIEIVNPGPVFPRADGTVIDVNRRQWTGGFERPERERLPPKCPASWTHWARYTEQQIAALEEVCPLLVSEYQLRAIVGHSDIAPGRKFDPGPMLDLQRLRELSFTGEELDASGA